MALATVTYKMVNGNLKFNIKGTGNVLADATAEANAKLALTVGTVVSAQESIPFAGTQGTPASGPAGDANLELFAAGKAIRNVHIENATTAILLAGQTDGRIDTNNALVTSFASNYRDGDGNGGYSCIGGRMHV